MSATALLEKNSSPSEQEVMDAIGGVLCRCTGYRKIIRAIQEANSSAVQLSPEAGAAVGARLIRLDGQKKVDGTEIFGADETPDAALAVRAVRSPYHRARFRFGDLDAFVIAHPGIAMVLTSQDVPGIDCYGVIPRFADQPVFAHHEARYRGEGVAAIVGETAAVEALDLRGFPVTWEELPAIQTIDQALAADAEQIHPGRANILVQGRVVCGDVDQALQHSDAVVEAEYETGFVEHAYIEPEAGFARRVGDQSKFRRVRSLPIWIGTTSQRFWELRRKECASSRPRSAAASDRSSICRFSHSSPWRHGS